MYVHTSDQSALESVGLHTQASIRVQHGSYLDRPIQKCRYRAVCQDLSRIPLSIQPWPVGVMRHKPRTIDTCADPHIDILADALLVREKKLRTVYLSSGQETDREIDRDIQWYL